MWLDISEKYNQCDHSDKSFILLYKILILFLCVFQHGVCNSWFELSCCRLPVFSSCQILINAYGTWKWPCQSKQYQWLRKDWIKTSMLQIWKIPWGIILFSTPARESYPAYLRPVLSAVVNCASNWFLGFTALPAKALVRLTIWQLQFYCKQHTSVGWASWCESSHAPFTLPTHDYTCFCGD